VNPSQRRGLSSFGKPLQNLDVLMDNVAGWLADKYGLSWQIVPTQLNEMMNDPDQTKVKRMSDAMFKMKKIDIAELKKAYDGQV
jgi:predicted 3-demethylubiquinone-9 3-methyltransferase (glyoxalase superfamily)